MRVLGLMGSPRSGGNTDTLLEAALAGARERGAVTSKLVLEGMRISPCSEEEYDRTAPGGYPLVKDDMYLVIDEMLRSDGVVVATPIFFGSLTAQVKTMIDRFQCVWLVDNEEEGSSMFSQKRRRGGLICCEATERRDFMENAAFVVRHFFATANIEYSEELFCTRLGQKHDAAGRDDLLEGARRLGNAMATREIKAEEGHG